MKKKHIKPPPAPIGNKRAVGNQGGAPIRYTVEWIEKEAELLLTWLCRKDALYFKSFAIERGYSPQRFSEFAEKSPVFSEALEFAKAWQEQKLVTQGLLNRINANLTKFVLSNCHGWNDLHQIQNQSNPLSDLLAKISDTSRDLIQEDRQCSVINMNCGLVDKVKKNGQETIQLFEGEENGSI